MTEPRYPHLTFDTQPAAGGRVSVTVSVSGPAHHWRDLWPPDKISTFTIQGAAAIRDTFTEAAAEAFNHPATQDAMRAFENGPVTVDYNEKWTPGPASTSAPKVNP